jgi:hypothetical protein
MRHVAPNLSAESLRWRQRATLHNVNVRRRDRAV